MVISVFRKLIPASLAGTLALILTVSAGSPSAAQSSTPAATSAATATAPTVTIMVGGTKKILYMPAELALQLGYFSAEGLAVTVIDQPSGVDATTEMLAGKVDGVMAYYDHTIDAQAIGKSLETIVQLSNVPGEYEVVATAAASQIKSPADFKDRTFGVSALGSSTTDLLTRYLASEAGVNPGSLNRITIGDAGQSVIDAVEQGKVEAVMVTEPTASQLIQKGDAQIIVDLTDPASVSQALGGPYPGASLYLTTDYVTAHPEIAQKLANAFVKTLRWIHTHTAQEIADKLPAEFLSGDEALYVAALNRSLPVFSVDGAMSPEAAANALTVETALNKHLQGKTIDISKTYSNDFVTAAKTALGPLPTMLPTLAATELSPAATEAATASR